MASPNGGEIEGKNEAQKTLLERKKVGFMKLKEDVEELWKISQEEDESFGSHRRNTDRSLKGGGDSVLQLTAV